jgi:UDP-GlcNAc:undecaprenyl-phosphate GlcNAc-1-phosphate transferase
MLPVFFVSGFWKDPRLAPLLWPAFGIFLMGLADDVWQLSPQIKLLVQVFLSLIPAVSGHVVPVTHVHLIDQGITVLWFVGLTNAFNLLDNMNGLAAGTAVIVAVFRGLIAYQQHDQAGFLLCASLASAVLGFLVFNFPRGLIFMGDSGALFLGYVLASFAFTGTYAYFKSYLDLLIFPVLMLLPICDTTFVTVVRLLSGRPISRGGKDHLSHSLLGFGFSTSTSVMILWLVCAMCGAVSLAAAIYGSARSLTLVLVLLATLVTITSNLARYQMAASGVWANVLSRQSYSGIAVTVVSDVLLAVSAYYTACLVAIANFGDAQEFFWRTFVAVVATKIAALALSGCYPRLRMVRTQRVVRIFCSNAIGSAVAFGAVLWMREEANLALPLLDALAAPVLIIIYRWCHQTVDRYCGLLLEYAHDNRD